MDFPDVLLIAKRYDQYFSMLTTIPVSADNLWVAIVLVILDTQVPLFR